MVVQDCRIDPVGAVQLAPGVGAEDVRRFLEEYRHLCGGPCGGIGNPTVLYLPGQINVYCRRSCREPMATVVGDRLHFLDPYALERDVVRLFEEYQERKRVALGSQP